MDNKEKLLAEWQIFIDGDWLEHKRFWAEITLKKLQKFIAAEVDVNVQIGEKNETPLHQAIYYSGSVELIRALIKAKANVNAQNSDGQTPLHYVAIESADSIRNLFKEKANLNAKSSDSHTQVHDDISKTIEIVGELWGAGGDLDARDNNCQTPLHIVAEGLDNDNETIKVALTKADS